MTGDSKTGGKESKQTEELWVNCVFYMDTMYSSSGSWKVNKVYHQVPKGGMSTVSQKAARNCGTNFANGSSVALWLLACFICSNIYISST